METKALVIGLGFAGSVAARELAEAGFNVTVFEKRSTIAGNMYEYYRPNGVRVHMYGPHIFHTNSQAVFDYLSKFSSFYPYTHRVLGKIDGKTVPIPFNFTSIDLLFPTDQAAIIKTKLLLAFPLRERISISELTSHSDADISALGDYVFEKVFVHYTAKQWGVPVSQVDVSVINRVPVVLGTDDRYFSDSIQMMPQEGYTKLFENILNHPNIHCHLESDATDHIRLDTNSHELYLNNVLFTGPVVYSGPVDELFGFTLGALMYRSLNMQFEDYPVDRFQPASVVNYPNEEDFTRITEFKQLTMQKISGQTSILKEYPLPYSPEGINPPYYPIPGVDNQNNYDQYLKMSRMFTNLYLCGRLAEYRYYNMVAAVEHALHVARQIKENYCRSAIPEEK